LCKKSEAGQTAHKEKMKLESGNIVSVHGDKNGKAGMKEKIEKEDGTIVSANARDMANTLHETKTKLEDGTIVGAAGKKNGERIQKNTFKARLEQCDKEVYIRFTACKHPVKPVKRPLLSCLKPDHKRNGTFLIKKSSNHCCGTTKKKKWYFCDEHGNALSQVEVTNLEEMAANWYYINEGKEFRDGKLLVESHIVSLVNVLSASNSLEPLESNTEPKT
jgi:hypothetical protein